MKDHVYIAIVGDEQVGKSSLISTYVSRHFPEEVPHVMTDAIIPAAATTNHVRVTIMDTSADSSRADELVSKLHKADSIILLFDSSRRETFDNLSEKWLPLLRDHAPNKPVVVVAAKADQLEYEDNPQDQAERLTPLFNANPSLLAYCHCSAKALVNVDQVFYHGETVVSYPLAPLFDMASTDWTVACKRAFKRVFRIYDVDRDGLFSDQELCQLQIIVFAVHLKEDEVSALKKQIMKKSSRAVRSNKITFEGFLELMKIFIDKSQPQTPWAILRFHGYEDNLTLSVRPDILTPPRVLTGQITDLSAEAETFLTELFYQAMREPTADSKSFPDIHATTPPEEDGHRYSNAVVTPLQFAEILSVLSPDRMHPWAHSPMMMESSSTLLISGVPAPNVPVSLQSWLTHWHMLASLRPVLAQELLFSLGYSSNRSHGVEATAGRNHERRKRLRRKTFRCLVFGAPGCGKSTLVKRLSFLDIDRVIPADIVLCGGFYAQDNRVNRKRSTTSLSTRKGQVDKLSSTPSYNYAVVTEVPSELTDDYTSNRELASCDVVVLVFDCSSADSLSFVQDIESRLPDDTPRLYAATRSDTTGPSGISSVLARAVGHCQELGAPEPVEITSAMEHVDTLQAKILNIATRPQDGIPRTIQKRRQQEETAWTVTCIALTTVLLSIGGYLAYTRVQGKSVQEVTQSIVKAFRSASNSVTKFLGMEQAPLSIAPEQIEPRA